MKDILKNLLAGPSRRLGTIVGSSLAGYGLGAENVTYVVALIPALCGLGIDLLYSSLAQRKGWK